MQALKTVAPIGSIQIEIGPETLIGAIKSVRKFISIDPTRSNVCNLLIETVGVNQQLRLTATDGYTACALSVYCTVIDSGVSARLTPTAVDALLLQAQSDKTRLKALGMERDTRVPFEIVDCIDEAPFPDVQRLIPPQVDSSGTPAGFDANFLARLVPLQKFLGAGGCRIQLGKGQLLPLRIDVTNPTIGSTIVLIMPTIS